MFSGNRDTPYMVFEYMLHGDLAELLRKTDPSIRGSEPSVNLSKVSITYTSKLNYSKWLVSMIKKYHNHKTQANPWHSEEEPHSNHETPGRQTKQRNQLSLPHQDDCKTRMDIK